MDSDDVDRAVEIVRRATSHNEGEPIVSVATVGGSLLDGDFTRVDLTMSSWPRAEEALNALRRDGFRAVRQGDCGVMVTQ